MSSTSEVASSKLKAVRRLVADVRESGQRMLLFSTFTSHLALIREASARYEWDVDLRELARIWTGGCIIRARFLETMMAAYGRDPALENLLVFYLPDENAWREAVDRLEDQGHRPVPSFNPYWDRVGKTFADPDGYRVVLQNAAWNA